MAIYRTARKKIAEAMVKKIKEIDGSHPFNLNVFENVSAKMVFLDEIQQYPKVCVVAGDETREYQPGGFKWRFLTLTIRAYVHSEDDAQEELALLVEDIEKIIDDNDVLVYDDSVNPSEVTTSLTIESITTDEGVIQPLGIGEITVEVRY
tara:strand:+ start:1780 stop:2229 length:450 start_codon:yes stop_codon:yes gene_type:complete